VTKRDFKDHRVSSREEAEEVSKDLRRQGVKGVDAITDFDGSWYVTAPASVSDAVISGAVNRYRTQQGAGLPGAHSRETMAEALKRYNESEGAHGKRAEFLRTNRSTRGTADIEAEFYKVNNRVQSKINLIARRLESGERASAKKYLVDIIDILNDYIDTL
jgi:hypothetical protein